MLKYEHGVTIIALFSVGTKSTSIPPRTFDGLQIIGSFFCFGTPLYYLETLVDSKQLCHYSMSSPSALFQESVLLIRKRKCALYDSLSSAVLLSS
jgi:hypothetical protein